MASGGEQELEDEFVFVGEVKKRSYGRKVMGRSPGLPL